MKQSDTLGELAKALAKFQGEVEGAKKKAVNPHLKNKYADLASIWEAIREPLSDNGLSVVQLPAPSEDGRLHLVTRLLHASGEWLESEIQMPVAKQDPQGYGSALTYARRYGLAAMLGIIQEDDDAEGAMKRDAQAAKAQPSKPAPMPMVEDNETEAKRAALKRIAAETNLSTDVVTAMAAKHFKGRGIVNPPDVSAKLTLEEVGQLCEILRSPAA